MSKNLLLAGALAMVGAGCASSAESERRAENHEYRARQAAATEDYDRAAQEKHEAERLRAKAAQERMEENTSEMRVYPPPEPGPVVPVPAP